MRTRTLGSDGPEFTVIGYGGWEAGGTAWGPNASDQAVIHAIRTALDAGIGWIDTAEVYGDGVSETLVGRAVAGRRDDVLIASKVAPDDGGSGFRRDEVLAACDGSLARLGIERIDLYQLHWPDTSGVALEETWDAMAELQDAGKVRLIGVSNFDRDQIERCLAIRSVDSLQQEFSMLQLEHRELIRWCAEQGIGVVAYGPLGFGLLAGSMTRERAESLGDWRSESNEGLFTPDGLDRAFVVIERLKKVAERLGTTPARLALAWNWHQPGVTSAIAGSRDPDHVLENASAGDLDLDDETLAELEAVLA